MLANGSIEMAIVMDIGIPGLLLTAFRIVSLLAKPVLHPVMRETRDVFEAFSCVNIDAFHKTTYLQLRI